MFRGYGDNIIFTLWMHSPEIKHYKFENMLHIFFKALHFITWQFGRLSWHSWWNEINVTMNMLLEMSFMHSGYNIVSRIHVNKGHFFEYQRNNLFDPKTFYCIWAVGSRLVHYFDHALSVVRPSSLTFHIFNFSETTERNSTKLDRKQALSVLYQVCVFRADRKTRWPPLPKIGWDIFDFPSETAGRI